MTVYKRFLLISCVSKVFKALIERLKESGKFNLSKNKCWDGAKTVC